MRNFPSIVYCFTMREGSNISKYNDLAYSENKGLFVNLTFHVNLWCYQLTFIQFRSKLIISFYFFNYVRKQHFAKRYGALSQH